MLCLAEWLTASRGNPVQAPFKGVYSWGKTSGQAARVQLWPIPVSPQLGAELGWWHGRRPRSAPKLQAFLRCQPRAVFQEQEVALNPAACPAER